MASTTEGWHRRHLSAKIFPKLGAMRLLPEHLDEYVERTDRVSYCLRIEIGLSLSEPSPRTPHRIGMEGKKIQRMLSERCPTRMQLQYIGHSLTRRNWRPTSRSDQESDGSKLKEDQRVRLCAHSQHLHTPLLYAYRG